MQKQNTTTAPSAPTVKTESTVIAIGRMTDNGRKFQSPVFVNGNDIGCIYEWDCGDSGIVKIGGKIIGRFYFTAYHIRGVVEVFAAPKKTQIAIVPFKNGDNEIARKTAISKIIANHFGRAKQKASPTSAVAIAAMTIAIAADWFITGGAASAILAFAAIVAPSGNPYAPKDNFTRFNADHVLGDTYWQRGNRQITVISMQTPENVEYPHHNNAKYGDTILVEGGCTFAKIQNLAGGDTALHIYDNDHSRPIESDYSHADKYAAIEAAIERTAVAADKETK